MNFQSELFCTPHFFRCSCCSSSLAVKNAISPIFYLPFLSVNRCWFLYILLEVFTGISEEKRSLPNPLFTLKRDDLNASVYFSPCYQNSLDTTQWVYSYSEQSYTTLPTKYLSVMPVRPVSYLKFFAKCKNIFSAFLKRNKWKLA